MIHLRRGHERGRTKIDWLESYHTFSFGDYHDPRYMGFRSLRVINDDKVLPSNGFHPHSHRDMEIITYILEGRVQHQDSTGQKGIIEKGEAQRMTAGSGITHSEINPSDTETLHLLQIWIMPEKRGLTPGYEQKTFRSDAFKDRFCVVASPDGREGSMKIHQDAALLLARTDSGAEFRYPLSPSRYAWLHVAKGEIQLARETLKAGDGASFETELEVFFKAGPGTEVLLFDLA